MPSDTDGVGKHRELLGQSIVLILLGLLTFNAAYPSFVYDITLAFMGAVGLIAGGAGVLVVLLADRDKGGEARWAREP